MKKISKSLLLTLFAASIILFSGCQKNVEIPSLTTTAVSDITSISGVTGGSVTSGGGAEVTERGVCWSTSHDPTTSGSKTLNGTFSGIFTSDLSGLDEGTIYFVRAYAVYDNGPTTVYGNELSFTTLL
jgi:hypothetical protein